MTGIEALLLAKSALVAALGIWMGIISLNNLTDPRTTTILMHRMMSMEGIDPQGELGTALRWRAIGSYGFAKTVLYLVASLEVLIAGLLLRATYLLVSAALGAGDVTAATSAATLALGAFMGLFLFFLCGGVWFMYWLTMGELQSVHFTGLLIALASLVFINT